MVHFQPIPYCDLSDSKLSIFQCVKIDCMIFTKVGSCFICLLFSFLTTKRYFYNVQYTNFQLVQTFSLICRRDKIASRNFGNQ